MKKESISYYVMEKSEFLNGWLFCGTLEQCVDFVKAELRNREKKDGYDEYWHNAELMIIKQKTTYEDTGIKL